VKSVKRLKKTDVKVKQIYYPYVFNNLGQSNCRNSMILYLRTEIQTLHSLSTTCMKSFLLLFTLVVISACAIRAQADGNFNPSNYINGIENDRKLKDEKMKTDDHSPIPADERINLKPLNYYTPDMEYRKEATFKRFDQAQRFLMKTTTDRLPEYSLYGVVTFNHIGKEYSLHVYQNIELVKKPSFEKHLFVPFNDETNGEETYGGGRFLDVYETGEDFLVIDFNLAYNPYCAYNHKYSCPIPPEANSLEVKIKAGEKKWHQ
jgi:hypothetical protein